MKFTRDSVKNCLLHYLESNVLPRLNSTLKAEPRKTRQKSKIFCRVFQGLTVLQTPISPLQNTDQESTSSSQIAEKEEDKYHTDLISRYQSTEFEELQKITLAHNQAENEFSNFQWH